VAAKQLEQALSYELCGLMIYISFRIVAKLEDFCCSPEFTTFIAEFQQNHAHKFTDSEE
jgi:hypothetical protein